MIFVAVSVVLKQIEGFKHGNRGREQKAPCFSVSSLVFDQSDCLLKLFLSV